MYTPKSHRDTNRGDAARNSSDVSVESPSSYGRKMSESGGQSKMEGQFALQLARSGQNKRLTEPKSTLHAHMEKFLMSKWWAILFAILTALALLAEDFVDAFLYQAAGIYDGLFAVLFVCLIGFTIEMVLYGIFIKGYILSFFFWLDLVGTLSLWPDIPYLWPSAWSLGGGQASQFAMARAGRLARSGARAARIVRMVRLVRMVRIFKLFAMMKGKKNEQESEKKYLDSDIGTSPSHVGQRLADNVSKRVIFLVIILLVGFPLLDLVEVDQSQHLFAEIVDDAFVARRDVKEIDSLIRSYRVAHQSLNRLVELKLESNGTTYEFIADGLDRPSCFAQNLDGGAGPEYNFYIVGLASLEVCNRRDCSATESEVAAVPCDPSAALYPAIIAGQDTDTFTQGMKKLAATDTIKFDITERVRTAAGLNIGLTFFILMLFLLGSMIVSRDAQKLVVEPLERMTKVAQRLAKSIFSLSEKECEGLEGMESIFLEETIMRMASFFDVKRRRITWLYAPDETVWTIDVTKDDIMTGGGSSKFGRRIMHKANTERHKCIEGKSVQEASLALAADISLADLLYDPQAVRYLRAFAEKEYCEESLLFLLEVERFNAIQAKQLHFASHIYKKFIVEGGAKQVGSVGCWA